MFECLLAIGQGREVLSGRHMEIKTMRYLTRFHFFHYFLLQYI